MREVMGTGRKSRRTVPSSSLWDKMGETRKPIRTKEGNPGSILCWEDEATAGGKAEREVQTRKAESQGLPVSWGPQR